MMIIRIRLTLYQVSLSVMEHYDVLCHAPFVTVIKDHEMIPISYDDVPIMTLLIVV
jgi:hypothetical protein